MTGLPQQGRVAHADDRAFVHMLSHTEVANARPAVIYCFRTGLPVLVKAQLLDFFFWQDAN
jgi:hypothetical protein